MRWRWRRLPPPERVELDVEAAKRNERLTSWPYLLIAVVAVVAVIAISIWIGWNL